MAYHVGSNSKDADKLSQTAAQQQSLERLRDSSLGAFFRPSQLEAAGLTRNQLDSLLRSGGVERIGRGLYRLAEVDASENYSLAMACTRIPNSIVCLLSALRVHGVGSQSPAAVWLAIPHKARAPRMPMLNLRLVRFSTNAWTSGIQDTTFEGVPARITTPTRTIADCFRFERLIGSEAPMEALRDALDQRIVTIAELAQAVKQFPSRRLAAVLDSRSL